MELLLSEKEVKVGDLEVIVKRIALLDTLRITAKVSDVVSRVLNSSEAFNVAMYKLMYDGRKDENGNEIAESDMAKNTIRAAGAVELIGLAGDDAVDLLKLIISKSTNLDKDQVENLDSVDGIDLLESIYEVNKSFFKKCMSKLKEKTAVKEVKKAKLK